MSAITETPPYTSEVIRNDGRQVEYRSVPGKATSLTRRIDISCALDLTVAFWRLREERAGIKRTLEGVFIIDGGIPLLWPVPADALYEDVLVIITPFEAEDEEHKVVTFVHIMDHWHTS